MKKSKAGRTEPVEFVVFGEAASKANSRLFTTRGGKPRSIKSPKAIGYATAFGLQCPKLNPLFEGDVHVEATIYYASRRPDLDESVILDGMQGKVYHNDRQVKRKTIEWGLDKRNPRVEVRVSVYG
jgi:Holliday junction resolvase RusA-like endonuclease